jgi:uncharacterized protein (TIGR03435 family)
MAHRKCLWLFLACSSWCGAQSFQSGAIGPVFDVASVKLNRSGENPSQVRIPPGGRVTATNATLRALITTAYQIQDFDLEGGPGWVSTDRYDVEAKASGSAEPPEILRMLQTLLADRFKLVLHQEQREKAMYMLTVSPGGARLEAPHAECNARFVPTQPDEPICNGFTVRTAGLARGFGVTMARLSFFLSRELGRPVADKTGLDGTYDLTLKWTPSNSGDGGPDVSDAGDQGSASIFTAIREQLGLRLNAERGPVSTTIIDSVQRPTEN